jgi:hypothetical protein
MNENLRVRPIDVNAPGSFRERTRILRTLAQIRSEGIGFIEGQLMLDELLASRLETIDGSSLEEAMGNLSVAEADAMVKQLLVSEVPTESAGN